MSSPTSGGADSGLGERNGISCCSATALSPSAGANAKIF
jgi:hypothetical protein